MFVTLCKLLLSQVTQILREQTLTMQFLQGSQCDEKEMHLVFFGTPGISFRDIDRHTRCCTTNLTYQRKTLIGRKLPRQLIENQAKLVRLFPSHQTLIGALTHSISIPSLSLSSISFRPIPSQIHRKDNPHPPDPAWPPDGIARRRTCPTHAGCPPPSRHWRS